MEFSERSQQPDADVTSGMNDNFKAKLEKLMQDKNKNRDGLQVPIPLPRSNEVQNPLENLQPPVPAPRSCEIQNPLEYHPIPLPRPNEIQNPLQNASHPPPMSGYIISRPPPPPPVILLPPPQPRTDETQRPLENVSVVDILTPLRVPPFPPLRPTETQTVIPNGNNLRSPVPPPIPLIRPNEIQNPLQNISHPPPMSGYTISRPPPPPPVMVLSQPPPRTDDTQRLLENVSEVDILRPLRVPLLPSLRLPETQTMIPSCNANGNNLRSPVPPPRTDSRKPQQNVPQLDSGFPPLVNIPPLVSPPGSSQQQHPPRNVPQLDSGFPPLVNIPPLVSPPGSSQQQHPPKNVPQLDSGFPALVNIPPWVSPPGRSQQQHPPKKSATSTSNSNSPYPSIATEGNKEDKRERFNEADVDAYLLLEPALAALNIGLPVGEIKRAIKEKLERTGFGFQSGDDLIEDVLKFKEEGHHQEDDCATPRQISEIEIQLCLRSEPALAALNLGLSLRRVKQAIKEKLERTGYGFSSEDALIEAALNIPEEEELSADKTALTEKSMRRSDEERLCKICMDAEICIVFIQCGHLMTCLDCSKTLKNCPLCRCPIQSTVRTFLP